MTGMRTKGVLAELVDKFSAAVQPFAEVLFGIDVFETEFVAPGQPVHVPDLDGRRTLHMHPIDFAVVAGRFPSTAHGHLEASLEWQIKVIDRAASAAVARIEGMHR